MRRHSFSKSLSLALISIGFLATGCSTIHGTLVAPEIETPTLTEAKRIDLNASIAPAQELTLFSDASARPPSANGNIRQIHDDKPALFGGISYGFQPPISLSGGLLGADALVDGLWGGAKVQLLGNRGWIAEGAVQLSAYARVGYSRGNDEGDRNGEFGPHGFPWESERSSQFGHFGASLGYLVSDWLVAFAGGASGRASTEAEIVQKASTDGVSSAGGTYRAKFSGKVQTLGLGTEILMGESATLSVGWHRSRFEVRDFRIYDSQALLRLELVLSQRE
jgi:hypothetical protein